MTTPGPATPTHDVGIGSGIGLLLFSRTNAVETGAMTFIVPAQFLTFVIAPVIVVGVARSLGDAVQSIVASFVFGGVVRTVGRVVNSGVAAVGTVDIDRKTDS